MNERAKMIFEMFDSDRDGKISHDELVRMLLSTSIDPRRDKGRAHALASDIL